MEKFNETEVLTTNEWLKCESGTKAYRVKTYNDSGDLVEKEYILLGFDNSDDLFEDAKNCAPGYYTDSVKVTRK